MFLVEYTRPSEARRGGKMLSSPRLSCQRMFSALKLLIPADSDMGPVGFSSLFSCSTYFSSWQARPVLSPSVGHVSETCA